MLQIEDNEQIFVFFISFKPKNGSLYKIPKIEIDVILVFQRKYIPL